MFNQAKPFDEMTDRELVEYFVMIGINQVKRKHLLKGKKIKEKTLKAVMRAAIIVERIEKV